MAEVLIGRVGGPKGSEVPHDVVCNGSPDQSTVGKEKQVHIGLLSSSKTFAHVHPLLQVLRSKQPLYALPVLGEGIVEEPDVLMPKVMKIIMIIKFINIARFMLMLPPPLMARRSNR